MTNDLETASTPSRRLSHGAAQATALLSKLLPPSCLQYRWGFKTSVTELLVMLYDGLFVVDVGIGTEFLL